LFNHDFANEVKLKIDRAIVSINQKVLITNDREKEILQGHGKRRKAGGILIVLENVDVSQTSLDHNLCFQGKQHQLFLEGLAHPEEPDEIVHAVDL